MTIRFALALLFIVAAGTTHVASAQDQEEQIQVIGDDGYQLDGVVRLKPGTDRGDVRKVIVLIHGSGPQSMDEDLTEATKDKKPNLFFRDLSETLADSGFAVVRYNKRSYQVRLTQQTDPGYFSSEPFKVFAANPLKYFVDDASAAVRFVKDRFPGADIYLLGHSQGAYIALQVADTDPDVKGVALVGFMASSTDVAYFEQSVYRPVPHFDAVDTNGDGRLDAAELRVGTPVATSLLGQLQVLDVDVDSAISRLEFQGGNLSNLLLQDAVAPFREQEARYPRPAEILKRAAFKVVFFQGLWDNQTPAYNAMAVQMAANVVWKKDHFRFVYFPGLGHALDARTGYDDLQFDTIDPTARLRLGAELSSFFER